MGRKYVEEYLLAEAKRVLPQLQATVRRVAQELDLEDPILRIGNLLPMYPSVVFWLLR